MNEVPRSAGRSLFGEDPEGYDRGRPDYPAWVFDSLQSSGALFDGAVTLEIGPGTGLATRHLIDRGSNPITLVEPDKRLAAYLRRLIVSVPPDTACNLKTCSFEDADLRSAQLDLIVAATAFQWVEPTEGLHKVRQILKPGGTLALFWNLFQDVDKPDPFHEATRSLLAPLARSPSGAPHSMPYALDRQNRENDAARAGLALHSYQESGWTYELSAEDIACLYGNFSQIQRLAASERSDLLEALVNIARTQFDGRVQRNMTTCLYQFRPGDSA